MLRSLTLYLLLFYALGSDIANQDASVLDFIPQEILGIVLTNVSSYQLNQSARVSKRFKALCDKIYSKKYQSDYYAIGLEYFAPETKLV